MNKIEEKQFKSLALVYEEFYGETLEADDDVIDKINSLAYILSNKFGIDFVDDYYVDYIKEEQKLYSPLLMDLVHKYVGKVEKDNILKLSSYTLERINFLNECLNPYLELHNDKTKTMNDLSVVLYIKEHNPNAYSEEIASLKDTTCTEKELDTIFYSIDNSDKSKQYKLTNINQVLF